MAYCAIAKTTLRPGGESDALEARYMGIVGRHKPEDVRAMPELLGIAALALQEGGCDFIGQTVSELELLNSHLGQFFTPYDVCRLMAQMQLADVDSIIEQKGFVTVSEPACGAGGMVLAVAEVIKRQGHDVGLTIYADCIDVSPLCFHMAYVQLALAGIPAMVRRGNTLSLEMFEHARTPALLPFLMQHGDPFGDRGESAGEPDRMQPDKPVMAPLAPPTAPERPAPTGKPRQLSLF